MYRLCTTHFLDENQEKCKPKLLIRSGLGRFGGQSQPVNLVQIVVGLKFKKGLNLDET